MIKTFFNDLSKLADSMVEVSAAIVTTVASGIIQFFALCVFASYYLAAIWIAWLVIQALAKAVGV